MNYTVVWLPQAENELAALWMASTRRGEVTRTAAELDRRLAADAPNVGESRPGGRRITFEPPVAMTFRVYSATRVVIVSRVWEYR